MEMIKTLIGNILLILLTLFVIAVLSESSHAEHYWLFSGG